MYFSAGLRFCIMCWFLSSKLNDIDDDQNRDYEQQSPYSYDALFIVTQHVTKQS